MSVVQLPTWLRRSRGENLEAKPPRWGHRVDQDRDPHGVAALWRVTRAEGEPARHVSDRTWRDLSMDAVFALVDRTVTRLGQQVLYARMRAPSVDREAIARFDAQVRAFSDDEGLRDAFPAAVKPLARGGSLDLAPLLYGEAPVLPRTVRLARLASFVWPVLLLAVLALIVGNIALRVHLHDAMGIHVGAMASLVGLIEAVRNVAAIEAAGLAMDLAALRDVVAQTRAHGAALRWLTLDMLRVGELAAMVVTYLNVFLLFDVIAFDRAARMVASVGPALRSAFETLGGLDAARSVASFRAGTACAVPVFAASGAPLVVEGLRHPLVDDAVPNDARMDERGWLVLGSNMSGKSTFLEALGLQAILAQSIATVTCTSYVAPPLRVRTLMNLYDDVLAGRSLFFAEAEAARDMLLEDAGGVDRLCIVDELFRGTNTVDRVAAAAAFLRALRRRGRNLVIAATHDSELISALSADYLPHHFGETVSRGALTFDYRLRAGAAAPRNALAVLTMCGFPPDVVADAAAYAAEGERPVEP
jgi:hypothetical protein